MRLGVASALARGAVVPGDVEVAEGRVVGVGRRPAGRAGMAVPGFVDLQVNGYAGVDFLSADSDGYRRAGRELLRAGVTAYQPTFVTSTEAAMVDAIRRLPAGDGAPRILGAHVEGPFLSPERPGAHPREHLRAPDAALLDRLLDAGRVTQMTLAPELAGSDALIARLRERGVVVAAGHTDATAAEGHRAFDLGVSGVTHVFNAMRPFRSRDPGIAAAALTRPGVVVGVVVDGYHLADEAVRLVWACAAGRTALVTDAIAAAGAGSGTFRLGDVEVDVADGGPPMRGDGTLAGTALTMIEAVRNLHALGVPLADAVGAATSVPAAFLGRGDVGVLEPGGPADVVVLDDRLEIASVLCAGEEVAARS